MPDGGIVEGLSRRPPPIRREDVRATRIGRNWPGSEPRSCWAAAPGIRGQQVRWNDTDQTNYPEKRPSSRSSRARSQTTCTAKMSGPWWSMRPRGLVRRPIGRFARRLPRRAGLFASSGTSRAVKTVSTRNRREASVRRLSRNTLILRMRSVGKDAILQTVFTARNKCRRHGSIRNEMDVPDRLRATNSTITIDPTCQRPRPGPSCIER
jgi:hypothetical protein